MSVAESRPTVEHDYPFAEEIDGAVLEGVCHEVAVIFTDHADCDVCLMLDQDTIPGNSRHALMRMNAEEARTLAAALLAAASPCDRCGGSQRIVADSLAFARDGVTSPCPDCTTDPNETAQRDTAKSGTRQQQKKDAQ